MNLFAHFNPHPGVSDAEQDASINGDRALYAGFRVGVFQESPIGTVAILEPPTVIAPIEVSVQPGYERIIPQADVAVFPSPDAD